MAIGRLLHRPVEDRAKTEREAEEVISGWKTTYCVLTKDRGDLEGRIIRNLTKEPMVSYGSSDALPRCVGSNIYSYVNYIQQSNGSSQRFPLFVAWRKHLYNEGKKIERLLDENQELRESWFTLISNLETLQQKNGGRSSNHLLLELGNNSLFPAQLCQFILDVKNIRDLQEYDLCEFLFELNKLIKCNCVVQFALEHLNLMISSSLHRCCFANRELEKLKRLGADLDAIEKMIGDTQKGIYPDPEDFGWIQYTFSSDVRDRDRRVLYSCADKRRIYEEMYRLAKEKRAHFQEEQDVWTICKDFKRFPGSCPKGKTEGDMNKIREEFLRELKQRVNPRDRRLDVVIGVLVQALSGMANWKEFVSSSLQEMLEDCQFAYNYTADGSALRFGRFRAGIAKGPA